MSSFAATPPEVLENITNYLGGVSILRLWSTGNGGLQRCLSIGGGITGIVLQDRAKRSISQYPSILDNLTRLTHLSINRGSGHLCEPQALWNHLSKLLHLRSLHLWGLEAESWLLEEFQSGSQVSTAVSVNDDRLRLKSFAATFLHLESLSLHPVKSLMIDSDLAYFPPSITSLDLSSLVNMTTECLKHFPGDSLMELKAGDDFGIDAEMIGHLPRTLTSLSGTSRTQWDLTSKVDLPDLHVLKLIGRNIAVEHLPNSLRNFTWQFRIAQPNLGIPELPFTKLNKLVIADLRGSLPLEEVPKFPASVETLILHLHIRKPSDSDCRLAFPPRLKHLRLALCDINGFFEEQLPASLVELVFYPRRDSGDVKLLSTPLPPALMSLHIRKSVYQPDSRIELFEQLLLPPKLTHLSILKPHHFTASQLRLIPKTVTNLAIILFDHAENCFALLPSNLLNLDLKFNSTINLTTQDMRHLSPHIVHLSLQSTNPGHLALDEDKIKLLPPNLITLVLHASGLTDDAVKLLPRSITEFTYEGDSLLTGGCFAFLPREVRHISLRSILYVKDEDFKGLPPSLSHLFLPTEMTLTSNCLTYLPRSLLLLECSKDVEAQFDALGVSENQAN